MLKDFGKKITQVSQDAVKETKRLTDITVLNTQINKKKNEKEKLFKSLGELFYNSNEDDIPEGYEQLFDDIDDALIEIESMDRQVQILKGSIPCPKCNEFIANGQTFCSNCGYKTQPKPKMIVGSTSTTQASDGRSKKVCSNCNRILEQDSEFCEYCGTPYTNQVEYESGKPTNQEAEKLCKSCGKVMLEDEIFCSKCGAKFELQEESEIKQDTVESKTTDTLKNDLQEEVNTEEDNSSMDYQEEIAIQETVDNNVCSQCGRILSDDELFCDECGTKRVGIKTKIDETQFNINEQATCPKCGFELLDSDEFCIECGYRIQ